MVSTAPPSERLYEASLRQGQVKHALKTALACCLATGLSYYFRLPSGQFAPVFAYLLMTMGLPSPRLNWLLAQLAIGISAIVSALLLVAFGAAPLLYLAVTLLWIFTCLLFTNWFSLPASLGAMVSALGIFVMFSGDGWGDTVLLRRLLAQLSDRRFFGGCGPHPALAVEHPTGLFAAAGRSLRPSGSALPTGGRPHSCRRAARGGRVSPGVGPVPAAAPAPGARVTARPRHV